MSRHRVRPLKPGRMWGMGDYEAFPLTSPDDPRYDDRSGDELYADELMLSQFARDMRKAREQQRKEKP